MLSENNISLLPSIDIPLSSAFFLDLAMGNDTGITAGPANARPFPKHVLPPKGCGGCCWALTSPSFPISWLQFTLFCLRSLCRGRARLVGPYPERPCPYLFWGGLIRHRWRCLCAAGARPGASAGLWRVGAGLGSPCPGRQGCSLPGGCSWRQTSLPGKGSHGSASLLPLITRRSGPRGPEANLSAFQISQCWAWRCLCGPGGVCVDPAPFGWPEERLSKAGRHSVWQARRPQQDIFEPQQGSLGWEPAAWSLQGFLLKQSISKSCW